MKPQLSSLLLIVFCWGLASCEQKSQDAPDVDQETVVDLASAEPTPTPAFPFQDATLPVEERVNDLISRLTLDEKVAQMYDKSAPIERLGIKEYNWWNEALHGVARAGEATVFPQAIGLAATFDTGLMHRVASAISDEGRAKHHFYDGNGVNAMYTGLTFWSPNINIFRDPRWGRGQETYGEDPFLTGALAVQFVKGLQGDDSDQLKSVATVKHFAVHSGPEKTRHSDNYSVSDQDLRETYLPAFEMAVRDGQVESMMCAYNRFRGEPACGSEFLLDTIFREEFGFDGYVVSDCGAIGDFYYKKAHNVVANAAQASAKAVKAGTDLNCGDHNGSKFKSLLDAVANKQITEAEVDQALARLISARIRLGMFDVPKSENWSDLSVDIIGSDAHQSLALEAAEKSWVLLKNSGVLPLENDNIKVAVIGPNANNIRALVANYSGVPTHPKTIVTALQERLGAENVFHAAGSALAENFYSHFSTVPAAAFSHTVESEAGSSQALPGLVANYYDSPDFTGEPAIERIDSNIDFYWQRSPLNGEYSDEFSVTWRGQITVKESGVYQFSGISATAYSHRVSANINGKAVTSSGVMLEAGQPYTFEAKLAVVDEWHSNTILPQASLRWVNTSVDLKSEALIAAAKADVIIFVGGLSPDLEGEEMDVTIVGFDKGDRTNIQLPDQQLELLKALHQTGKPLVHVNLSGSAVALNWSAKNVPAILQGFYPGEAAGTALANILFGDANPSGRLPVTFYRSVDDLPGFSDYAMMGRTYKYYEGAPLYKFGHGLSYSSIFYSPPQVYRENDQKDAVTVSVNVTNRSYLSSEEVVQVYAAYSDTEFNLPRLKLVAFERISLSPNDTRRLEMTIPEKRFAVAFPDGSMQLPSSPIGIHIGSSQPDLMATTVATGGLPLFPRSMPEQAADQNLSKQANTTIEETGSEDKEKDSKLMKKD